MDRHFVPGLPLAVELVEEIRNSPCKRRRLRVYSKYL